MLEVTIYLTVMTFFFFGSRASLLIHAWISTRFQKVSHFPNAKWIFLFKRIRVFFNEICGKFSLQYFFFENSSFSHDGKYISAGSENQCVFLWRTHYEPSNLTVRKDRNSYYEAIKGIKKALIDRKIIRCFFMKVGFMMQAIFSNWSSSFKIWRLRD